MDELRDYRFYADDMMHPSAQAADYIFERFMDFALADSDKPLLAEAGKIRDAASSAEPGNRAVT